jgi:hypothetical protein
MSVSIKKALLRLKIWVGVIKLKNEDQGDKGKEYPV